MFISMPSLALSSKQHCAKLQHYSNLTIKWLLALNCPNKVWLIMPMLYANAVVVQGWGLHCTISFYSDPSMWSPFCPLFSLCVNKQGDFYFKKWRTCGKGKFAALKFTSLLSICLKQHSDGAPIKDKHVFLDPDWPQRIGAADQTCISQEFILLSKVASSLISHQSLCFVVI